MSPLSILSKYYDTDSRLYAILLQHSQSVTHKAVEISLNHPELNADTEFIAEAAMLHDIGIFLTNAPQIECYGKHQYIEHGYLGADILRAEGLPRHALVCERHTGTGLSVEYIRENNLPLPLRDLRPVSIEEQIICYADKFFSKSKHNIELPLETVRESLRKYGEAVLARFDQWSGLFFAFILLNL
ncbi:MAG: HDIG domain-containing protein [Bacteroidota bacterium]|nr:HDIG domain-containing protein [Bacteroidota bacterium]